MVKAKESLARTGTATKTGSERGEAGGQRWNERRADIHEAFLSLGCAVICWKHWRRSFC